MTDLPRAEFLNRATPPHVLTLVTLAGSQAMAVNMFLPSLPAMAEHFGTEYSVIQLSVALFLASSGVLQILIGPLSDRFGRRPILLAGFGMFSLATIGCIFAPNVVVFLMFRMLQASIAVGMVLSRAIVRDMYDQEKSASVIGYVTMGMSIVPMLTPALGGVLQENFGWQASFWTLLITGLAVVVLIWADSGETNQSQSVSLAAQVRDYPILLTSQRFWGYAASAALSSGAFFAYLGGAPFVGVQVYGLAPDVFGLYFGAPALGYLVGNGLTGRYSARVGINRMILAGSILASVGIATALILSLVGYHAAIAFFAPMTFLGLGNGLVIPNATAGLLSVRPQLAGTASGLGGALMILGGAGLSALAGTFLDPQSGPYPLLSIQLTVILSSIVAIVWVMRREKRLGLA